MTLNRIYLYIYKTNPRAIHVYEKCGFVHEGNLKQSSYRNGRYIDILLMSMLRREWDAK